MQGLSPLTLTLLALLTVPGARADAPVTAQQQEIQCKKVLEADDVASLLEAGVSKPRVKLIVTTCKVDFELTDALEKRFRSLGATAEILLAITRNYQCLPAPSLATANSFGRSPSAPTALSSPPATHHRSSGRWPAFANSGPGSPWPSAPTALSSPPAGDKTIKLWEVRQRSRTPHPHGPH